MIILRSERLEEDRRQALLDLALDDAGVAREEPEHAVVLTEHEGPEARETARGPRDAPSVDSTGMRNFSPEAAKSGGGYLMAPAVRPET